MQFFEASVLKRYLKKFDPPNLKQKQKTNTAKDLNPLRILSAPCRIVQCERSIQCLEQTLLESYPVAGLEFHEHNH